MRQLGGFGPNPPQSGPSQGPGPGSGPILPPPSHYASSQSNNHNLPHLSELTHGPSAQHQPAPYGQHSSGPSHNLPGMGPGMQHSPPGPLNRDREREMREQELRERDMMERERLQREEMLHRERERERELERQRDHRDHPQHQSHTGSIPIHQPVASKIPNTIHGPNGLLSNNPPPALQVGGGPGGLFNAPPQGPDSSSRQFIHQPVQPPQPQSFFGGPGPSPMQGNAPSLAQGQQPILNDALSYLDQVKVRFSDQPDVYNRFLDIMKDFKSQAIDTPGVIDRVSNLFNGHPALIQGFNTFLPPGYRIECGTDDNPDAIRVTTPSGTMTQNLPRTRPYESSNLGPGSQSLGRQEGYEQSRGFLSQQHPSNAPLPPYSPGSRPAVMAMFGQQGQAPSTDSVAAYSSRQEQENAASNAALVHQQEQRGVSQLQNAASAAANGTARSAPMAVSPEPGGPGDVKRGPVEFNHAISYVNKIKNRFAQQPEIYKQFLEILQTYQRESKPIQDVYAQVTQLFNTAPDLLEDFKQFLPESAAAAKAQAAARSSAIAEEPPVSNIRGDTVYGANQIAQAQTPRPTAKMPPMGQFDPPSTSKENKKRRAPPGQLLQTSQGASAADSLAVGTAANNRLGPVQVGNASKRTKLQHTKPTPTEQQQPQFVASPTLIPALPEPLPPISSLASSQDEFAFFDRVRKVLGNKGQYAEFLKLVNVFTQDLIDKYVLFDRMNSFIGSHPELLNWFAKFIGIEPQEEVIEGKVAAESGRVNLSHCRMLGPSYRKLPDKEQHKLCKGRDDVCYSVLNDEWASHPTWESEDSGFIAHRKNIYEEALHRLEEERHDYDFNIEACQRTIQLMEPLVQQIRLMTEAERANFVLAKGLGGQSEAIYTRVIKKVYDRDRGETVIQQMFAQPTAVLPVVLSRLKQKLEEWKAGQREWEKIWRDQTNRVFWKSLDHQGQNVKNNDKKIFTPKHVLSEISAKYEERKKIRESGLQMPKHQLEYAFTDPEVITDACHILLVWSQSGNSGIASSDQERIAAFLKDFIPVFFNLDRNQIVDYMEDIHDREMKNESEEGDEIAAPKPRVAHLKKSELLRRGLLDRRNGKEGSVMSGSKESTPAPAASEVDGDDTQASVDVLADVTEHRWMEHPKDGNLGRHGEYAVDEPYERDTYQMYANNNIYVFFRFFQMLYSRLLALKESEEKVHEIVAKAMSHGQEVKPAVTLKLIDKLPTDFFKDVSPTANYYKQVIQMCEDFLVGDVDQPHLEDTLRRYYLKSGWQLYTVDKLVAVTVKAVHLILGSDSKDKSLDIVNLFFKDRDREVTTRSQELQYRKQVQKLVKDGEIYRISFNIQTTKTEIRYFPSEELTFESDELNEEAKWSYYVLSYSMIDPTEGIPWSKVHKPYLRRNLPGRDAEISTDEAFNNRFGPLLSEEHVEIRVIPETYKLHFEGWSVVFHENSYFKPEKPAEAREGELLRETKKEQRNARFEELFVRNTTWMKGKSGEEVDSIKADWQKWLKDGPQPASMDLSGDVEMGDA